MGLMTRLREALGQRAPARPAQTGPPGGGIRGAEIRFLREGISPSYPQGFLAAPSGHRAYASEIELDNIRNIGRWLNQASKHASGAAKAITSYVIGDGEDYRIVADGEEAQLLAWQKTLQSWMRSQKWRQKTQEASLRYLIDGEVFLRVFPAGRSTQVRFILPELVRSPQAGDQATSYGIECTPQDYEEVLAYHVIVGDGARSSARRSEHVPPEHVHHLRHGVFSEEKRGIPLFYPWRHDLIRADTLLRTLEQSATNQARISAVIEYPGSREEMQSSVEQQGVRETTDELGRPIWRDEGPGGSYDIHHTGGMSVSLPNTGLDGRKLIVIYDRALQAISVAAKLPLFIFAHHTDQANRSNTDRAQDDGLRHLQNLQGHLMGYYEEVLTDVARELFPEAGGSIAVRAIPRNMRDTDSQPRSEP